MISELTNILKARQMKRRIDWNTSVPKHIAIMMDGNGRWAAKRGLPRTSGHFAGMKTMKKTIRFCKKNNVQFLTLYAFSSENWTRPKAEVDYIIGLIKEFVTEETLNELNKNNIKLSFIGDITKFSTETQNIMHNAVELTKENNGMTVNFAVNYGGRNEIVRAIKNCLSVGLNDITEKIFESNLYTFGCPDPELIIRTSGEKRLSGFLLWQSAQSELWFTEEMWPSFNEYLFLKAVYEYQCRKKNAIS